MSEQTTGNDGERGPSTVPRRSWYEVLEVKPDASREEIEAAYRRALRIIDGKSLGGYLMLDPDAKENARHEVERAFNVLSDPEQRARFDRELEDQETGSQKGRRARRRRKREAARRARAGRGGTDTGSPRAADDATLPVREALDDRSDSDGDDCDSEADISAEGGAASSAEGEGEGEEAITLITSAEAEPILEDDPLELPPAPVEGEQATRQPASVEGPRAAAPKTAAPPPAPPKMKKPLLRFLSPVVDPAPNPAPSSTPPEPRATTSPASTPPSSTPPSSTPPSSTPPSSTPPSSTPPSSTPPSSTPPSSTPPRPVSSAPTRPLSSSPPSRAPSSSVQTSSPPTATADGVSKRPWLYSDAGAEGVAEPRVIDGSYPSEVEDVLALAPEGEVNGGVIRRLRENRGISLDELAEQTHIRKAYLKAIEDQQLADLPARVYLRGFLTQIARVLKVDKKQLAEGYMTFVERFGK